MTPTNNHQSASGVRVFLTYTLAAVAIFALAILLFSCLGAAVFFLPLLAGAFK